MRAVLSLCCALIVSSVTANEATPTKLAPLRRGVNILGYDGLWKGELNAPFHMSDFKLIHDAGFDHVRVNFFGFRFMTARGELDQKVLARLDRVIESAVANDLDVVLDQHDNALCQSQPRDCQARLVAFWRVLAARYAGKQPRLIYEILNEPGGAMGAAEWNQALNAALAQIRAKDPHRAVIVAALNVEGPSPIDTLALPDEDRDLIVTLHYYAPFSFTHQGAPWSKKTAMIQNLFWGAEAERQKIVEDFAAVDAWAKKHRRPIYLGEFGVYDAAPLESRAAWMQHVARSAERFGWGWAYWQFDHDFALFDSAKRQWNKPLIDALIK